MTFAPDSRFVDDVVPSANVEPRRAGRQADMLLLHYTGMRSAAAAIDWLARPESKVSCHYVIDVDGRITQMVPEALRAWHAGVSCWQGDTDVNTMSVGIEIQNPGHEMGYHAFPMAQMKAVAELGLDIVRRHQIMPARVLAHSDVAPQRKIDPGEKFDWRYLHHRGLGAWTDPTRLRAGSEALSPGAAGRAVETVQALLRRYGYDVAVSGDYCITTQRTVAAFQRHYRPACVDGCVDLSTLATLERLVAGYVATLSTTDQPAA